MRPSTRSGEVARRKEQFEALAGRFEQKDEIRQQIARSC